MTLFIRHIRIRVATDDEQGVYGIDLPLREGLNIFRSGNTMGKSQVMNSVIYGLGLERMFGPQRQGLFAYALTDRLETPDGDVVGVLASSVHLEFSINGQVFTLRRAIKSSHEQGDQLVTVWHGPALSASDSEYVSEDFYVNRGGSAANPRGFHNFLVSRLGWQLPTVARHDGGESPLYTETLFPYLFVEQKSGWQGTHRRFPTAYGILSLEQRSFEFLMGMDAINLSRVLQGLRAQEVSLKAEWRGIVEALALAAGRLRAIVQDLPKDPPAEWPRSVKPTIQVLLDPGSADEERVGLRSYLQHLQEELARARSSATPTVREDAPELEERLQELEFALADSSRVFLEQQQQVLLSANDVTAIDKRIGALKDDKKKHDDARVLADLGSDFGLDTAQGRCPTCDQQLADTLQPRPQGSPPVMSLDTNLDFINEQLRLFKAMFKDAQRVYEARQERLYALRSHSSKIREEIRSIKRTLTADSGMPSEAAIRRVLVLEGRVESLESMESELDAALERFGGLARQWRTLKASIADLSLQGLSKADQERLEFLEEKMQWALSAFGFSSVPPKSVFISHGTYRPEHQGIVLDKNMSASDGIRLVWAYLLGILETSIYFDAPHPRLLMLDEPKQQSAERPSFVALLKRSSRVATEAQIIIATSEDASSLERTIAEIPDVPVHVLDFKKIDGKLLRPVRQ